MNLVDEANKCLKCKKPRCSEYCPVSTPIPDVIKLFMEKKPREAGRILFENNPLSAVTSIVCPHERNCYGHCVLNAKGNPVNFFEIEQYISWSYLQTVSLTPPPSNGMRVAVIGAGPAGISCSIRLALKGFKVTLIDARCHIGGVLRYGIPEFRLPKNIIDRYSEVLHDLGVYFKPNTFIGSTVSIDDMFIDGYKAVFIAVGTSRPNKLGLLGETLGHVCYAVDYLRSPSSYFLGENVVVVGAGNVGMDASRTAVRMAPGSKVYLVNNGDEADMTCDKHEVEMAEVDGVRFIHNLSTLRITEEGVVCARTQVHTDETTGRRIIEEQMDQIVTLPADNVILAIGQGPQAAVLNNTKVDRTTRGLVAVDETGNTTNKGVFAAGDIVTGPRTVIEAVAFANKVADEIEKYCLTGERTN